MAFTQRAVAHAGPCRARRGRCTVTVWAAAGKRGFGAAPEPEKAAVAAGTAYWVAAKINVAEVQSSPNARKPLILADGKTSLLFWWVAGQLYCTSASSPAFEYPLLDAELVLQPSGATSVRSRLEGSLFDLATGKVLEWCPKEETPFSVRNLFATLKERAPPVDLKVFQARADKLGNVEVLIPVRA